MSNKKYTEFSDRIKKCRILIGFSKAELARRVGVSPAYIGQLEGMTENNQKNPSPPLIKALCKELNVNPSWLKTGKGEKTPPQYPVIDPDKLKNTDIQFSTHEENSNTPDPLTTEERILLENYRAADSTIQNAARTMLADSAKESGGNGAGGINCTEQKSASK